MPVITVALPAHPALADLLAEVEGAVTLALRLAEGDVIVAGIATSGGTVPPWPIVTIRGGDRGLPATALARDAAETAVRAWASRAGCEIGGVWTEWTLPTP